MNDARVDACLNEMLLAKWAIQHATGNPDPVAQRESIAQAAEHLRKAADQLDSELPVIAS